MTLPDVILLNQILQLMNRIVRHCLRVIFGVWIHHRFHDLNQHFELLLIKLMPFFFALRQSLVFNDILKIFGLVRVAYGSLRSGWIEGLTSVIHRGRPIIASHWKCGRVYSLEEVIESKEDLAFLGTQLFDEILIKYLH